MEEPDVRKQYPSKDMLHATVKIPDSEVDLTDLPDLEEIPQSQKALSRAVKATIKKLYSSTTAEPRETVPETNKILKKLRTQFDRAVRSLDEQRTIGAHRANGGHIPPG